MNIKKKAHFIIISLKNKLFFLKKKIIHFLKTTIFLFIKHKLNTNICKLWL